MATAFQISELFLGDMQTNKKGSKTIPVSDANKPIVWTPEAQKVPFEPKSFNGETRVNLVMHASPSVIETLSAFDEQIVQACFADSLRIFGKALTLEEVRLRYTPCLKISDKGYEPTWKAKISISEPAVKCWNADKTPCALPESWTRRKVQPRIVFRCLWFMPTAFGCLCECTDALLSESETKDKCPF